MSQQPIFGRYAGRLREFIEQRGACPMPVAVASPEEEAVFNSLALDLFGLHYAHNPSYRALCQARKVIPTDVSDWRRIPAVPAVAFKEMEMTLLCPGDRTAVFCSSGTSGQAPGRHFHCSQSLAVYEASLLPWFQAHLLPEGSDVRERFEFIALTPPPSLASHSSLVHMLGTIHRRFASGKAMFVGETDGEAGWRVNYEEALQRLGAAEDEQTPVVLMGTAFNFVHLLDEMAHSGVILKLSAGSRVMETGGYKGRTREMLKDELHTCLNARLGISHELIVCEYGMCELSSQAYDRVAGGIREEKRGRTMNGSESVGGAATEKPSPLTPALSPLRGEGGANRDPFCSDVQPREHQQSDFVAGSDPRNNAAELSGAPIATPSPLNGERAGVRGETSPAIAASSITSIFPRVFHFPPWARVQIISPESGREVGDGETGLIRVLDLANVASAPVVQTEDLAIRRGEGFELIGRATEAEPRGCSLRSL